MANKAGDVLFLPFFSFLV